MKILLLVILTIYVLGALLTFAALTLDRLADREPVEWKLAVRNAATWPQAWFLLLRR